MQFDIDECPNTRADTCSHAKSYSEPDPIPNSLPHGGIHDASAVVLADAQADSSSYKPNAEADTTANCKAYEDTTYG